MSRTNLLYASFFIALASTLVSLYFSEVLRLTPCPLCWYQRIFMYPLVVIIAVGILLKDKKNLPLYVLPLSALGLLVSFYQNLLYFDILKVSGSCVIGVSCATKFIKLFGFLDIPQLSFLSFLLIIIFMLVYMQSMRLKN